MVTHGNSLITKLADNKSIGYGMINLIILVDQLIVRKLTKLLLFYQEIRIADLTEHFLWRFHCIYGNSATNIIRRFIQNDAVVIHSNLHCIFKAKGWWTWTTLYSNNRLNNNGVRKLIHCQQIFFGSEINRLNSFWMDRCNNSENNQFKFSDMINSITLAKSLVRCRGKCCFSIDRFR